jgi:uncharacterized coiled-coil DUF342 family protein
MAFPGDKVKIRIEVDDSAVRQSLLDVAHYAELRLFVDNDDVRKKAVALAAMAAAASHKIMALEERMEQLLQSIKTLEKRERALKKSTKAA